MTTSPDPTGRWLIDGNNVMGSRPDGWWRDRVGAKARLAGQVAAWAETNPAPVVLVFDGRPEASISAFAGGRLAIRFAVDGGRDAADDEIVELAKPGDTVVSADRGLIGRLPDQVDVVGPRALLALLPAASGPSARSV